MNMKDFKRNFIVTYSGLTLLVQEILVVWMCGALLYLTVQFMRSEMPKLEEDRLNMGTQNTAVYISFVVLVGFCFEACTFVILCIAVFMDCLKALNYWIAIRAIITTIAACGVMAYYIVHVEIKYTGALGIAYGYLTAGLALFYRFMLNRKLVAAAKLKQGRVVCSSNYENEEHICVV